MTEQSGSFQRVSGLRRGPVEPLSPQAWQRVETAVFDTLEASAVPWSLAPAPLHSYAAPRVERPLRVHWAASVGLALASAAAAASVLHLVKHKDRTALEAGSPAESTRPEPEPTSSPALDPPPPTAAHAPPSTLVQAALPRPATAPSPRPGARREPAQRSPARSDRERLFERAASLESADPSLALALYLSLASGDDAWAANALYAAARLEIDRGLRGAGAQHLEEYVARFPHGENIIDVRGLRRRAGMEF